MRYIVIFSTTIILALLILFYPRNYLLKFKDSVTIDYESMNTDNLWTYEIDNDNLMLENNVNNLWKFIPKKDGETILTYYYNKVGEKYKYKIIYKFIIKGNKIIWKEGEGQGLLDYPNPY